MEPKAYIAKLNVAKSNLPEIIEEILKKNEGFIVGMLKFRLFTFGTDGNENLIGDGQYAPKTIARKRKAGQKVSVITLRDKGNFYNSMFLEVDGSTYEISSKDPKAPRLVDSYGESILDLTQKQQDDLVENIIDPALQKYLDANIPDIDISL